VQGDEVGCAGFGRRRVLDVMGGDFLLAQVWMDMRVEEFKRQADADALARQLPMGLAGRLPWRGSWLLARLGSRLVMLGERLEQYAPVHAVQ
jgi:hypothetical protein